MTNITANTPIDFSAVEDGFQARVSTLIIDELSIAGKKGNRRRSARKGADSFEQSIREHGIIQPLVARPNPLDTSRLELIGGYGRLEIASKLQLADVPVLIRQVNDETAFVMHLDENSKRSDLSLLDEVEQAREFASTFNGDRKAVAQRLGWTLKKVNERLELGNCSEPVLDALDKGEIKPAHALILSNFPETTQNNTVAKCIAEQWNAETLAIRAGKVQIPLSTAKFDKTNCNCCSHNTGGKAGLFDFGGDDTDKCSNFSCFRQKTVDAVRPTVEEKYGKVILLSETSSDVVNRISHAVVGDEQFNDGCTQCENNVAILSDNMASIGIVTASQCTDRVCFVKCSKAYQDEKNQAVKEQAQSLAKKQNDETEVATLTVDPKAIEAPKTVSPTSPKEQATDKKVVAKKKDVTVKLSASVTEHNKALLRDISSVAFKRNIVIQKAITLASLITSTGFKATLVNGEEVCTTKGFESNVRKLTSQEVPVIDRLIVEATQFAMSGSTSTNPNYTNLMISLLNQDENKNAIATKGWLPTQDNLKIYTKQSLSQIADKSGFAKAYNESTGKENGFAQLENGSKDALIKALVSSDFDWSDFAPSDFIGLIK